MEDDILLLPLPKVATVSATFGSPFKRCRTCDIGINLVNQTDLPCS